MNVADIVKSVSYAKVGLQVNDMLSFITKQEELEEILMSKRRYDLKKRMEELVIEKKRREAEMKKEADEYDLPF